MAARRTEGLAKELQSAFGSNLRAARERADLTQQQVAEQLGHIAGRGQSYISEIEAGRINLTIETMAELAAIVGSDVRALLGRKPHKSQA